MTQPLCWGRLGALRLCFSPFQVVFSVVANDIFIHGLHRFPITGQYDTVKIRGSNVRATPCSVGRRQLDRWINMESLQLFVLSWKLAPIDCRPVIVILFTTLSDPTHCTWSRFDPYVMVSCRWETMKILFLCLLRRTWLSRRWKQSAGLSDNFVLEFAGNYRQNKLIRGLNYSFPSDQGSTIYRFIYSNGFPTHNV